MARNYDLQNTGAEVQQRLDQVPVTQEELAAEVQSREAADAVLDGRLETVEGLAEISVAGGDIQIATAADFNIDDSEHRAKIPTVGAIKDYTDDVPTPGSSKFVKSGGAYADTHLCNVKEVNDFVVDIVLKEGVEIDFSHLNKIWIGDIYGNRNVIAILLSDTTETYPSVHLFSKSYTSADAALAAFGTLMESNYCYIVLRHVGFSGGQKNLTNKSLVFNRDISWKSLNEHPIIKELLIEQSVEKKIDYSYDNINGYTDKNIDEPLTTGMYWNYTTHKRNKASGFVSNDVTSCKDGDVFIITGTGGDGASRLYVFTDADGNNIDGAVAEASEVREDYTLPAPEGAAYFYFTAKASSQYKLQKQSSYKGILNELAGIHNDIGDLSASTAHGEAAYDELFGEEQNPDAIELESGYWYVKNTPPTKGNAKGWYRNPADSVLCEPGDTFILTGKGGTDSGSGPNSYLWAFADSSGVILRHADVAEKRVTPFEVTSQEGEVRFYMSSSSGVKPTLFKRPVTKGLAGRVEDLETAVTGIGSDIADMQEDIDNSLHSVSKMFNVPVDLKKPNLKVLDLGNSYTGDATHYLVELLTAANITTGFSVYRTMRSGASFRDYVNMYKETDDATYGVYKVVGDTISGITGSFNGLDNTWFVNLLKQDWDIIIIHQESIHSTNYDGWTGDGAAGGLTEYLRILRTYCPQAAIGFYIVHSYPSWRSSGYQIGANSTERWQNIAKAVEQLKAEYGIDFIIPYGTAVQNLRMASINPADGVDETKKNDFSDDGTHLNSSIGDYVAACTYFEALFAPRYNVTVLGNGYRKTTGFPDAGGHVQPVAINDANALLAQRAAVLAVNDMFHLINPEAEGFVPVNSDTKPVYTGDGSFNDVEWSEIKNRPTKVSDFTNDAGFVGKSVDDLVNYYLKSETYTKTEVQALISSIKQFTYQVVPTLPTASADTMYVIYLVPSADPQQQNVKDEYITIDNGQEAQTRYTWEQIGSTAIDLSGYVTTTALNEAFADSVHISSQILSESEKQVVRRNIGAASFNETQVLMSQLVDLRNKGYYIKDLGYMGLTMSAGETECAKKEYSGDSKVAWLLFTYGNTGAITTAMVHQEHGETTTIQTIFFNSNVSSRTITFTNSLKTVIESVSSWSRVTSYFGVQTTNTHIILRLLNPLLKNSRGLYQLTLPAATTSTAGTMSATDKTKLDGIEASAQQNVQPDWNQSDSSADDYIKNKPTNLVASTSVRTIVTLTQAQYDALTTKDANTEYNIIESV